MGETMLETLHRSGSPASPPRRPFGAVLVWSVARARERSDWSEDQGFCARPAWRPPERSVRLR